MMSRILWASAAIAIGISLTPSVALAAKDEQSGSHSQHSRHSSTSTHNGSAARVAVLAIGAGYAIHHGSPAVRLLQRRLVEQGISPGPVDGRYGPLTAVAVRRLQQARGLTVDGIVGPQTRAALAIGTLGAGAGYLQADGSQRVRSLQRRLAKAGFAPGPADGRYGPRTRRAVMLFQQARRLPADGIAGRRTQDALGGQAKAPAHHRHQPAPGKQAQPKSHAAPAPSRQPSRGNGNHAPAPASPKSTTAGHGGHTSVLTVLVVIAVGALAIALLLAFIEATRWRRPPAAASASEASSANDTDIAAAPTAVASLAVATVVAPSRTPQPDPKPADREPADREPAPDVLNGVEALPRAEIAVARVSSNPQRDESDDSAPEPPSDPARAEQVKALQRQLAVLGLDPGPVDGRYGPHTTDAVKHLQDAVGLEPDGIVGPLTAEALHRNTPKPPADERAKRVKALQSQLSWLGFEPGPVDGRYGPLTTGAVRRFQQAQDIPVDGIVDPTTAETLRASIAQRPSTDRSDRIKLLQGQLHWLGFEPGPIDGRYGPETTEAVRRFQEAHDLPVSGVVDSPTQTALQHSVQRSGQL